MGFNFLLLIANDELSLLERKWGLVLCLIVRGQCVRVSLVFFFFLVGCLGKFKGVSHGMGLGCSTKHATYTSHSLSFMSEPRT